MDYLARAIIGVVSLLRELVTLWGNGQGNIPANVAAQAHAQIGDSISAIFANGVNFIAALTAEILRQMGNSIS
jgi:antitoxin component of MazEF toxin-antitoxin module